MIKKIEDGIAIVKPRNGVAYLAFIIACIGVIVAAYIYYGDMAYRHQANLQIRALESANIDNMRITNVRIDELQNKLAATVLKFKTLTMDKTGITVFQVNELVSLANQGLVMYDDVPSAIKLLNHAKDILQTMNNPMFTSLKYALSFDLTKLNSLPKLDKVMLSGEIDSVVAQLGNIKLHDDINGVSGNGASATGNAMLDSDKWHKFLQNVKGSLQNLITVSTVNTRQVDALLPKEQMILEESIRVNLLSARLALQQHDEASWVYSLASADKILAEYFTGFTGVTEIRQTLASLLKENVALPDADIDATLVQLTKLNNLQH